jgi:hypothetical protein
MTLRGNYASARLWLLAKRPYEPTVGMTAASKNGIRRGSVTEDRPELGPPVGRLKTALMTTT